MQNDSSPNDAMNCNFQARIIIRSDVHCCTDNFSDSKHQFTQQGCLCRRLFVNIRITDLHQIYHTFNCKCIISLSIVENKNLVHGGYEN